MAVGCCNYPISRQRMLQLAVCVEEPRRSHAVSETLRRVQSVEIFQQFNLVLVTSEPQVAFCNVVTMHYSLYTVLQWRHQIRSLRQRWKKSCHGIGSINNLCKLYMYKNVDSTYVLWRQHFRIFLQNVSLLDFGTIIYDNNTADHDQLQATGC